MSKVIYGLFGSDLVESSSVLLTSFDKNKLDKLRDDCEDHVARAPNLSDYDVIEDSEIDRYEKDIGDYLDKNPVPLKGCGNYPEYFVSPIPYED